MASNIYYGICATEGAVSEKEVQLVNVSSELEGLHLQKGDFLSVYFVNGNEANGVTLTLYIGDINQEYNTSVSVDETVYNTGVIGVVPGAWVDGEVVNFSYTHNGSVVENADNNYYWEMVGKPIATSDTYGDIILDGEDPATAASQNKVEELIDERGIKRLSYTSAADVTQTIGTLRLDTDYPDGTSDSGTPITIKIPIIPTALSQLSNDAGYIIDETENNLTFTGDSKQIKVRNNGSDTTIINLYDSSNDPPDVAINSLNDINLNPTGHVNITLPASKQLNVSGGNGIACNKLDILNGENNRLTVDKIKSHTPSPNLITFESPINIPNGPNVVNGLQTDGITITSGSEPQNLDDYLVDVLGENEAKAVLDSWLASKLGNYLKTVRYHSKTGPISAGGTYMVELGGGHRDNYTINQQPENIDVNPLPGADLNLDGYDIVGIIAWETWGSNYACTNICSVYWNNNDPSTGFLKLRVSSSQNIQNGTYVSADILYKKKLRTIGE